MPEPDLATRIAAIAESATLAVDAKAKALKAAGEPVIGFGAGEPDFPTPAHIVEAAVEACRDPRNHRYTPDAGLPELREAIADKTKRDSGVDVAPAQVLVTNGGKHAVYNTFQTLLDPGDEVLLPAPYWTTYPEAIAPRRRRAGRAAAPTRRTGFRVTVEQLEAARTPRTKALLFVSPSNPTGAVYPPDEVEAIGRWAVEHGIWVVTDEIYEHLTFGEHRVHVDARRSCPSCRPLRHPQRRRQDLRHDRLAGRLDDRPARRRQGRHQPAVALDVERLERRPARRARRGVAARSTPSPRCGPRSSAAAAIAHRDAQRHRRRHLHRARRARSTPSRTSPGCSAAPIRGPQGRHHRRAGRAAARGGQGRGRPRRGVRRARATPASASPSATTTSARASPASPSSSADRADGSRSRHVRSLPPPDASIAGDGTSARHRGDRRRAGSTGCAPPATRSTSASASRADELLGRGAPAPTP